MLLRLLALARAPVELAEAEVAVGDETVQSNRGSQPFAVSLALEPHVSYGAETM